MTTLSNYLWVPKTEFDLLDVSALRRRFTVMSKYDSDKRVYCYAETSKMFGIPRGVASEFGRATRDLTTTGTEIDFSLTLPLWDSQKMAVKRAMSQIQNHGERGILIDAPTASGKTIIGTELIRQIGRTALVVVNKSDLVHQWAKELTGKKAIPSL